MPETKAAKEASKVGVWRCPICTYDNENDMSACDICGVLRNPLVKGHGKSNSGTGKQFILLYIPRVVCGFVYFC